MAFANSANANATKDGPERPAQYVRASGVYQQVMSVNTNSPDSSRCLACNASTVHDVVLLPDQVSNEIGLNEGDSFCGHLVTKVNLAEMSFSVDPTLNSVMNVFVRKNCHANEMIMMHPSGI